MAAESQPRPSSLSTTATELPSPDVSESNGTGVTAKFAIILTVVLLATVLGVFYYYISAGYANTDDAYTQAEVHNISARVNGTVVEVLVHDNQWVNQGDLLVRLDSADFEVQRDRAQANYDQAKADNDRVQALKSDVAISKQDSDQTYATLRITKAALDDANNQLSYCTLKAPASGYIGNKTVEVGNRIQTGGALMSVVANIWVVANFKETQVGQVKRGQHVTLPIDAFPDHKFSGYVESLAPGTGATFALLPPDNATGNFTKIVQRVPVKILFDPASLKDLDGHLVPGLSCEPSVDLRTPPEDHLPAQP